MKTPPAAPLFGALATACLLLACDSTSAPPSGPGTLTVSVESPRTAEGSALVRLVGAGLGAPSAVEGEVHYRRAGDTLDVVVLRPDPGVLRFALPVEDTTRKPRAELLQVAGGDDLLQSALAGYAVEVSR